MVAYLGQDRRVAIRKDDTLRGTDDPPEGTRGVLGIVGDIVVVAGDAVRCPDDACRHEPVQIEGYGALRDSLAPAPRRSGTSDEGNETTTYVCVSGLHSVMPRSWSVV